VPKLAENLSTGSGCLVQWRLEEPSAERSLGLVLTIEELKDRTGKLKDMCDARSELEMIGSVAQSMAICSKLLSRCVLVQLAVACFSLLDGHAGRVAGVRQRLQPVCVTWPCHLPRFDHSVMEPPGSAYHYTL
jgi:hypothetical protein